ncbi:DUF883 domain-containing protein [Neptunicella marina]|uniref:DUF883 domain-containing protein n=1 Tax=Neptunicella marina TaxID=2125989 RepID=A0A8J6M3G6_9ALTE|nr:DUF883 domain-containing protein [Neptunicella marina]MBC3767438.1 DUF883 domain-containing protein [Neptunicella marina]
MATQAKTTTSASSKPNGRVESHSPISDKMTDTLHHSVDALGERASRTEEKLRDTASASAESISEKQRMVQTKWKKSSVRRYAVENPLATAGVAFAAGMVLTSLLRKKS